MYFNFYYFLVYGKLFVLFLVLFGFISAKLSLLVSNKIDGYSYKSFSICHVGSKLGYQQSLTEISKYYSL